MKPNFSLILSSEGLELLHRTYTGWARVGEAAFDDTDLPAAITALQERAAHLPGDRSCKLVLPADQVKYLTIDAADDPESAVRAALDGATPYAVDELEYDWTLEDGTIHVAAVALETLGEAEDFAVTHGFEPVSFATIPDEGAFLGEPFFGATGWAAQNLPEGTVIDRDARAIRVTSEAEIPGPSDVDLPDDHLDDIADDMPVASAAAQAVAEAGPASRPEAGAAPGAMAGSAPGAPSLQNAEIAPAAAFASIRASRTGGDAPRLSTALAGEPRITRLGGADTVPAANAAPSLPSPAEAGPTDPALMAELAASLRPDADARLDRDAATSERAKAHEPPMTAAVSPSEAGARDQSAGREGAPGLFGSRKAKASGTAAQRTHDEKQRMTVFGARQSEVRGKPRFLGLILTAILLLFLVGVAAWASIFLDDGLSRFFGGSDTELAEVPAISETDQDPVVQPSDDPAPALIAPLPETEAPAIAALPDAGEPRPEVAALPDRPLPLSPSEALARYAATGIWQMAPMPPETPGAGGPVSDIFQVSRDPGIEFGLPATLPRHTPAARDTALEAPGTPPPAGMRFDFDERGFVRATPDGALTPEGVRVIAGRPPLTPPAEMAQTVTVTAEVPITPDADTETASDTDAPTETVVFTGDPALADTRPRLRPDSIIAEEEESDAGGSTAETGTELASTLAESTTSGGVSLAALRPQPRPEEITSSAAPEQNAAAASTVPLVDGAALEQALSQAAAQPEAASPAPAAEDPEAIEDDAFENVTPQAVTASLTPIRRPGDFESLVQRTQREAAAQPVPQSQQMQVALPSSASVARTATTENVLNMRDVNLIGVYGSSASRRALVRLSNGRYMKVRVGDRLDGGQVAAIGESELRYIKRGRNVVLRMPQG